MVHLYKWYCPTFYQFVSAMPLMKQLLLFLTILATGHLNITLYANVNSHLAAVLSHHWKLQYNDMQDNHIESNHDSNVFPMRFCIQWLLQVKFAKLWLKFWAFRNGCCFVICICMEVSLRIWSGRSDCVKPCFDITHFGSLNFGLILSRNISKSSNSGGAPVMKFEPTPQQYCIAFNFGWVTAHSKGLYGIVDPTIERIWETVKLRDFASWEWGWSLAQSSCRQNSSALAKTPRLF